MKYLLSIAVLKITIIFFWLSGAISSWVFALLLNPLTGYFLFRAVKKMSKNELYSVAILAFDLCIPFAGFIGLVIFYLCGYVFRYINYSEEDEEYLLPMGAKSYQNFELEKKVLLQSEMNYGEADSIELFSFFEVEPLEETLMGSAETQQKISAIDQLSRIGDRKAITILKKALKLKEYEVRYFANSALEEIEKDHLRQIKLLSESISEQPDEASTYKERGDAYLELYRLGLLDKSIEKTFLEKALMDFMTSLSLSPQQSFLYTRIVEINLLQDKLDELIRLADFALKADLSKEDKAKIYFYKAEACFKRGQYDQVVKFCQRSGEYKTQYDLINCSIEWWTYAG